MSKVYIVVRTELSSVGAHVVAAYKSLDEARYRMRTDSHSYILSIITILNPYSAICVNEDRYDVVDHEGNIHTSYQVLESEIEESNYEFH